MQQDPALQPLQLIPLWMLPTSTAAAADVRSHQPQQVQSALKPEMTAQRKALGRSRPCSWYTVCYRHALYSTWQKVLALGRCDSIAGSLDSASAAQAFL